MYSYNGRCFINYIVDGNSKSKNSEWSGKIKPDAENWNHSRQRTEKTQRYVSTREYVKWYFETEMLCCVLKYRSFMYVEIRLKRHVHLLMILFLIWQILRTLIHFIPVDLLLFLYIQESEWRRRMKKKWRSWTALEYSERTTDSFYTHLVRKLAKYAWGGSGGFLVKGNRLLYQVCLHAN